MSAKSKVRGVAIKQEDSRRMEDEARRMEAKLELLRKTIDHQGTAAKPGSVGSGEGGRWKSAAANKPLTVGYVDKVLEAPRPGGPAVGRPGGKPRGAQQGGQQRTAGQGRDRPPAPGSGAGSGTNTPRDRGTARAAGSRSGSGANTPTLSSQILPSLEALPVAAPGSHLTSPSGAPALPEPAASKAAANLQAAVQRQSEEAAEVEAFLLELKFDRYVGLFLEHGFDCMEVVLEMQESHMKEIGMATGHILKLRKRIAEMNPDAAPLSPPGQGGGQQLSETRKRVSFGGTEASSPRAATGGVATGTSGGARLADGCFNEDDSAASFQEALRAWRHGGQAAGATAAGASSPKKAAGAGSGDGPKVTGPGSFWSSIGGAEVDLVRASTPTGPPPGFSVADTETQPDKELMGDQGEKLCCYFCYKQFFAKYAVERKSPVPESQGGEGTKRLCSEACAEKWVASAGAKAEELRQRQAQLSRIQERQRAVAEALAAAAAAGEEAAV